MIQEVMKKIIMLFSLSVPLCLFSQDMDVDQAMKGWYLTVNAGVYQASGKHAGYYDGRPGNENNIDYVFGNQYWYNDIKNELIEEVSRDQFWIAEYPMDMHYQPSLYAGFSARYAFSDAFAINTHFNFSRLKLIDAFNLEVDPPLPGSVRTYIPCAIEGEESRSNIDLSMQFAFDLGNNSPWKPLAELGFNLNSVHVRASRIQIFDLVFNLRDVYGGTGYVPGQTLSEYPIRQGGVGYGLFSATGMRYCFSADFSAELCGQVYYSTIKLKGYEGFGLHYAAVLRLVMSSRMISSN